MTNLLTPPSATTIRDELLQAVLSDLLGPAGGPHEELDERNVRDRYLVGMLAPKRQELSPEEFDELAQGGVGSTEEGSTDFTAPPAKTMFPSSFGMTFSVEAAAEAFRFANRAMWLQRVRTIYALGRRRGEDADLRRIDADAGNHTWHPF